MTFAVNIAQGGSNNTTMRNRIINGAMVIDQRNAGAAVTVNSVTKTYCVDRFCGTGVGSAGVFTLQQTSTAPSNFVNSLKATVTTADASLAATDLYRLMHLVEGFNASDFGWGTASAQAVTLSFWVYSNLTGTFGGSLTNSAVNRSYPFTFTISSANTWEQKTITITGDTSGTWLTTNGIGVAINFGLGVGATYSGTANAWAGAEYYSTTGSTNVMASTSNTFYITGVQLEAGTTASPFEYRLYGTELALCRRYYWQPTNGVAYMNLPLVGYADTSTTGVFNVLFPTTMRIVPSLASSGSFQIIPGGNSISTFAMDSGNGDVARINFTGSGFATNAIKLARNNNDTTAYIAFSAEL